MISGKLKNIILNELNLEDYEIQEELRADEIPGWDSLTHINIILAIEKGFNIRFNRVEILSLRNIGELKKLVDEKLNS